MFTSDQSTYCVCLPLCSWADAEAVGSPGWHHEDWPACRRTLVEAPCSSRMQVKSALLLIMLLLLVFSSDKPVEAAMEKVRKAVTRYGLSLQLYSTVFVLRTRLFFFPFTLDCFVMNLYCSTGFRLKVNIGRRCWTSTGPKQRTWKGFSFDFFNVMLWLVLFKPAVRTILCVCCRKVEQGLEEGVSLSSASVAQSSQYHVIQSKPDYHSLCTQQPLLQAVEIFVREGNMSKITAALTSNHLSLLDQRWTRRASWLCSFRASGIKPSCWWKRPAVDWVNIIGIYGFLDSYSVHF